MQNRSKERKDTLIWLRNSIIRSLVVILLVMIAVFFIIRIVPGDPAMMILGEHANPDEIMKLHEQLNLDLPVMEQFSIFVRNIFLHGDTGVSIKYGISSRDLVLQFAIPTLLLVLISVIITATLTIILAFSAATHKDGLLDQIIRILPAFTHGMPVFWVGLIFILLFSVRLHIFPVGGLKDGLWGHIHSLILPSITVAFGQCPSLVRSLREQILEVLESDFVVTLKACGISKRRILLKHVLRNALVPTLHLLGVNFSYLIGGTLVIEQVFAIRGIGKLLFDAISYRDFPLVQAIALYCAFFVIIISLGVDLISHKIDPRGARGVFESNPKAVNHIKRRITPIP